MGYLRRQKLKLSFILLQLRDFLSLTEFLVPVVTRQNERVRFSEKSSPAHPWKGPERQQSRDTPNNTLSSHFPAPPAAINPEEHRGTTSGRGEIPIQDSEGRESCLDPVQGCPSRASVLLSRSENCHHESLGTEPSFGQRMARGGAHQGMQGKNILGLHRISMWFLTEDAKMRKRKGFGEFEGKEGSKGSINTKAKSGQCSCLSLSWSS